MTLEKPLSQNSGANKIKIVAVVGPTASGKSDLAVKLARRFKGEVISADSRQVYRGMDIGTGKITKKEMAGIPHHLLDIVSPKTSFTAAKFKKLAQKAVREISSRNKLPIICGGTGFYIDAFLYDWPIPPVPPQPQLRKKLQNQTKEELFKKLVSLDPERAATIDPSNKVRLIRALEIILSTGQPVPKLKPFELKDSPYEFIKLGLAWPKEKLKNRIQKRLLKRLKQGLVAEVKKLHRQGISWQRLDSLGLEYRWVSRYLRGLISKEEMIKTLIKEIWHYAKRQQTWFKKDRHTIWLTSPRSAFLKVRDFLGRGARP